MSNEDFNQTIIIRKKRSDGEEEHHGGVWKLAFADFMTAMMAFFLVMWLINSTSKETKAAIVQYFNPVQLLDSKPARKGLRDPKDTGQGSSMQQSEDGKDASQVAPGPKSGKTVEASLHNEPLKTLDELSRNEPASAGGTSSEALQDPFERMESTPPVEGYPEPIQKPLPGKKDKRPVAGSPPAGPSKEQARAEAASVVQEAIAKAIKAEMQGAKGAPKFEVKYVDEGMMISLTDDAKFSMFEIGSLQPKPELVRILEKVGKALATQPGKVEIAGHTDGRSYKSQSYDNWRLSSDRANMVHYMLVRGGLSADRVTRISGYADRRLKTPEAPLSPVNRRIEILLRGDST